MIISAVASAILTIELPEPSGPESFDTGLYEAYPNFLFYSLYSYTSGVLIGLQAESGNNPTEGERDTYALDHFFMAECGTQSLRARLATAINPEIVVREFFDRGLTQLSERGATYTALREQTNAHTAFGAVMGLAAEQECLVYGLEFAPESYAAQTFLQRDD